MIETERLMLSPVTTEDSDIYTKLLTCAETTRYLPGGKPFSLEYIQNYVLSKVAHWSKGYGTFIVALKGKPSQKIGYAGVELVPDSSFSDIRYALLPQYQGKGYAFEASKAVLNFTLESGLVSEVYGVAVIENLSSKNYSASLVCKNPENVCTTVMSWLLSLLKHAYNKAFKTDSQRLAVLVQISLSVYGTMA
ncbi:GNAT family N-acetyltransferase [Vibrio diabolicus]|uniref:GNAT family N-acetyltransferase n=1 Tax=Vibrio diabolicus TaxID=50719 RepID=UPI0037513F18